MKIAILTSLLLAAIPLAAQEKSPAKKSKAAAKESAKTADAKKPAPTAPVSLAVHQLTFTTTPGWLVKEAPRPMSLGGFTKVNSTIEADFYQFGIGQGGDTESNIKRWQGQFQPSADNSLPAAARETLKANGRDILLVTINGTFLGSSFAKQQAKPDYSVIGCILADPGGTIFIKVIGSQKDITAAKEEIKSLASSPFVSK